MKSRQRSHSLAWGWLIFLIVASVIAIETILHMVILQQKISDTAHALCNVLIHGALIGFIGAALYYYEIRHNRLLHQSEARYRDLFNTITSGVAIYEAVEQGKDFVFVGFNPAAEKIERVAKSDLVGKRVTEVFPGVKSFGLLEVFARVRATGVAEYFPAALYEDNRLSSWRENYVYKLETGEIVAVYNDITQRKQAEENLQNSEKWLRTTLNSVGDAVITTDNDGNVSFMNSVAQKLTAWSLEEAQGLALSKIFSVIDEQTRQSLPNPVDKVLAEKTTVDLGTHIALVDKNGVERPIADSSAPIIENNGEILGVVLIFRDVGEQRKKEAQLRHSQKLESIGTLAGGIAHEINNPITSIINFAFLILEDAPAESEIHENASFLVEESKRIANIVSKLLAFARQERQDYSSICLLIIVNDTLALLRKIIEQDQIKILVEVPENLPLIQGNGYQIMQVLINLLTNARDALNARYPDYNEHKIIKIYAQPTKKGISLCIEDFGTGIPPDVQKRIFDPFFTTKIQDQGTGLGLYVSHGIIRDHQATMKVESQQGEFTRFTIIFPVIKEDK